MTLKMTERDKKLLIGLILFGLIFGVGFLVIRPLLQQNEQLAQELEAAESEKAVREEKITRLPVLQQHQEELQSSLDELQKSFYPMMESSDVDKLLTGMALSWNLEVKDLDISMPLAEEYASLDPYLYSAAAAALAELEEGTSDDTGVYEGTYDVQVSMTMAGEREKLQSMLDACVALEPKLRVRDFSWRTETKTVRRLVTQPLAAETEAETEADGATGTDPADAADTAAETEPVYEEVQVLTYQLTMSLSMYMYEDESTYLARKLLREQEEAAAAEAEAETGTAAEAEELLQ